jgi:hypothetical protein
MKFITENILLPKNSTIVEGSFQVQIGTDWIGFSDNPETGEFSSLLTSQQLEDVYGITINAVNREFSIPTGALEFTDFEIVIGENLQGDYAFKLILAVPA